MQNLEHRPVRLKRPVLRSKGLVWSALTAGAGCVALLVSCATPRQFAQPLDIPGAHFVGNRVCAECHGKQTRVFVASPHGRIRVTDNQAPGGTGCEACHGPGSRHVDSGGSPDFIINPGQKPGACYSCHEDIRAAFSLPQHHPVPEGHMHCGQCHDPHGMAIFKPSRGLAMSRVNETCGGCHQEQHRPVMFRHEAMREGCTSCHVPHGSIHSKMLTERDPNLCLKCHAQLQGVSAVGDIYIGKAAHGAYLRQGTCWSAGCHSAVHGSNINPKLRY